MSLGRRSHRYHNTHRRRLPPWAIILICVLSALTVTVIIGTILKSCLDEDAYARLVEEKEEQEVNDPYRPPVPAINAAPYLPGGVIPSAQQLSFPINDRDGTPLYSSPVGNLLGISNTPATTLGETLGAIPDSTYVSGVFYAASLREANADLQYAASVRERALLREFLNGGGDELLLIGHPLTAAELPALKTYLTQLRQDTSATVGVAIPLSVLRAENGWEIIGELLRVCDFCALDLQSETLSANEDAVTFLKSLSYYRLQYGMRLLLSEEQTALTEKLSEAEINDYQILPAKQTES